MGARSTIGSLLGAVIGYFAGAYLACTLLLPASNLCGLPGAIVGVPLGALGGGWIARRLGRRRRAP
jgi:hypothetical protein